MPSKAFGLPIQFVAVAVVSAALIIYLIGWSAQSRIEARADSYRVAAFGEPLLRVQPNDTNGSSPVDAEKQPWEHVALFVCPLH